ncbi:TetR/AcrR family transcriptional regulator [Streptomyces sp. NBC_00859]|uniref:TetR/AcrR family transcriptional regulator n=1 Tax=Streptomyces sp. NBC_00859 TaxID=2903682 RepID=UPI00386FFD3A|nr:TetR family transcriptional regulator [Streptomyces sp. NBC_00859]
MEDGLRERKKQQLRDQLSMTTVLLAKERGLAHVRVEDIVERVGVSRRTFSNYFASKEEAIADRHVQRTREAAEALRGRPAGEPLWDSVTTVIVGRYAAWSSTTAAQIKADPDLISLLGEPEIQDAIARGARTATAELARAVADRLGTDAATDLHPTLIANVALSTQMSTLDFWLRTDPQVELGPLMQEAFQRLAAGFGALPARQSATAGDERK